MRRSTGFILEGFPRTPDEVTYLVEKNLFPDASLTLLAEEEDVVERLIPARMKMWKALREFQIKKKEAVSQAKAKLRVRGICSSEIFC